MSFRYIYKWYAPRTSMELSEMRGYLDTMKFRKQKELNDNLSIIHHTIEEYLKSKDGYSKSVIQTLNNLVPRVTELQTEIDLIKRIS